MGIQNIEDSESLSIIVSNSNFLIDVGDDFCTGGSFQLGGSPTAVGGTPPYTYIWASLFLYYPNGANPIAINDDTVYSLTVTDANGCIGADSVQITPFVGPSLTTIFGCDSLSNNVIIQSQIVGPSGPYSLNWSPGSDLSHPDSTWSLYLGAMNTGVFSVSITDANGCVDIDSVTFNTPLCAPLLGPQLQNDSEIKIYPNPVSFVIKIESNRNFKNMKIELFNSTGRVEMTKTINSSKTVDLSSSIKPGIYMLKIYEVSSELAFISLSV